MHISRMVISTTLFIQLHERNRKEYTHTKWGAILSSHNCLFPTVRGDENSWGCCFLSNFPATQKEWNDCINRNLAQYLIILEIELDIYEPV